MSLLKTTALSKVYRTDTVETTALNALDIDIAQVEFIDARSALTSAELNLNLTRFDVLVRLAELRAALGL